MGMKPMFNPRNLAQSKVNATRQRFEKALVSVLSYLGEELVNYARANKTYTDRTSNLTNSMGYVILNKGMEVSHGGEQEGAANGDEGKRAALSLYNKLAKNSKYDYTLIIVAGMNYAAYVEAKGYNVLLPAQLKANLEFKNRMRDLIKRADDKLKKMLK